MPVGRSTGSFDQIRIPDRSPDTSTWKVNDDKAADERKTGSLALTDNRYFGESLTQSTQNIVEEELGLVPYPDIFNLDGLLRAMFTRR